MSFDYISELDSLFQLRKERRFTDRTQIMEILMEALADLNQDPQYYHIFSIHGIGGIGKSRLIKEFISAISPESVFSYTFEIGECRDVINNLYLIRKQIPSSCPVFDYALLRYWELTNPASLNKEFMNHFQKGFFASFLDVVADLSGCAAQTLIPIPDISVPTASTVVDFVNQLAGKIPQIMNKPVFQVLAASSGRSLANALPQLLGVEIRRKVQTGRIALPVYIFDSYQESQPYAESEEWLYHLISTIGYGLFIITGREEVHWRTEQGILIKYRLDCYPETEARQLLEETISNRPDLVDLILKSTQCVPIYINLALDVYEEERDIVGTALVERALFLDRRKLVEHFINHFKPELQSSVLDLASIGIFNQEIFQYLSKERMIACSAYDYSSIIQSNLFSYIVYGTNGSLVKLHDVFCKDVQLARPLEELYTIFKTYLRFICYRSDALLAEARGSVLTILLQNLLSLAIDIEERMQIVNNIQSSLQLETIVIEELLDIFFTLVSARIRFTPQSPVCVHTAQMKSVCQLIYAKSFEKENTLATIHRLEEIENPVCFGKHLISYEAILFYHKALAGEYQLLSDWLARIDTTVLEQAQNEWFYNRIKVYQCDCDMMDGRFKTAESSLLLLKNSCMTDDDYYSVHRTLGHIKRFNLQLSEAKDIYNGLMQKYHDNTILREYLIANYCETECYFPSPNFIREMSIKLETMTAPYNIKNKAKILYSLAIANTVKKHYHSAKKYIRQSLEINHADGYISGELFAYMAQAYLDYSQKGAVTTQTLFEIKARIDKNEVYRFFELPLALMANDKIMVESIATTYEWLDFEQTVEKYRQFFKLLRQ